MMMRKTSLILALALVVSTCSITCLARDYKEQIGPYVIKFWLPDWIHPEMNKTIKDGETYSGIPYKEYVLDIRTGSEKVYVSVAHYAKELFEELDVHCEGLKNG